MKRTAYFLTVIGLLVLMAGCKKQESDAGAIRSGINQHLASMKTLNLDAMDMNITNVSIQGNKAQAQVEFKPKGGAPQGAGMQVAYSLEKENGRWVVQDTQIPHMNEASPSSNSMPNFRDVVPERGGSNTVPPGHPPVNTQGNPATQ